MIRFSISLDRFIFRIPQLQNLSKSGGRLGAQAKNLSFEDVSSAIHCIPWNETLSTFPFEFNHKFRFYSTE